MGYTVFYAWQMDRDKRTNRWFIHKAIDDAIRSVLADLKLEDAPAIEASELGDTDPELDAGASIEIDHDTKGEFGTPEIAKTILRKIENCGVFVADVSLVCEYKTDDGRTKRTPNPNVMIELGAAIESVGWDRIVLVMNRAIGSAEDLPFDLKYRSIKVGYDLASPDDPEKGRKRKELAKELAEHLRGLHHRGIITKKDDEERKAREANLVARAPAVEAEREEFEKQVALNNWHGLKADVAVLAVSVIPATKARLEFPRSQDDIIREFVHPIHSTGGHLRREPKALLGMYPQDMKVVPIKGVELLETGSLFTVWNVMAGQDSFSPLQGPKVDPSEPWKLHFGEADVVVNRWLVGAIGGLRKIGVTGPWFVGVSLLKMKNCYLLPSRRWDVGFASIHPCARANMLGETTLVPEDIDLTEAALGEVLKRPWKQIWSYCGHRGIPRLDPMGEIIRWEE
jgi:hypothetical protein